MSRACCIDRWYSSIPLLFILWRVLKAPIGIWVPLLFFLGLIVLIQGASGLIGPERMTTLTTFSLALKIRRGSALPATS